MPPKSNNASKKKTFKCLLSNKKLFQTRFKPSKEAEKLLKKLLPKLDTTLLSVNTPWSLKKLQPKSERKKRCIPNMKKFLSFGLKECLVQLKEGKLNLIFIDNDLNPRLLAEETISTAATKQVPVVFIEKMKTVTTELTGFPSACIGCIGNQCSTAVKDEILGFLEDYSEPKKPQSFSGLLLKRICNNENRSSRKKKQENKQL